MDERFLTRSAVFIALFDYKGRVLLHRRCNTGYMDGRYDLPSGHVERGERLQDAAARELQEEAGIDVEPTALHLWHINQFEANNQAYYNFFFTVEGWHGTPTIGEPEKCDDMQFFPLNNLPKLTAGSNIALQHSIESGVSFGYIDQDVYDTIASDN